MDGLIKPVQKALIEKLHNEGASKEQVATFLCLAELLELRVDIDEIKVLLKEIVENTRKTPRGNTGPC